MTWYDDVRTYTRVMIVGSDAKGYSERQGFEISAPISKTTILCQETPLGQDISNNRCILFRFWLRFVNFFRTPPPHQRERE